MIEANYTLEIEVISFLNPNHEHIIYQCGWWGHCSWNDYCCESYSTSGCILQCDNYFKFCLRDIDEVDIDDINYCPRGSYTTDDIRNSDDITFGSSIGGVLNPLTFSGTVWPVSNCRGGGGGGRESWLHDV